MARPRARKPLVGIVCDVRHDGEQVMHGVYEKYIQAIALGAGALPVLLPARFSDAGDNAAFDPADIDAMLGALDGIFLPGSPSNVATRLYDPALEHVGPADHDRDALALTLVRTAVERRVPLFGVCRGFQEINVALGGTLHPILHQAPGRDDHRHDESLDLDGQYSNAHEVRLEPGGLLADLVRDRNWHVNSLHGQGIDRLSDALQVEAMAEDGTVEAFRTRGAGFCLATQWHPEWRFEDDALSRSMFRIFGEAMKEGAQ
jgi:putative glutamine amidotransferase